ncbi:MAG: mechanosensitive ion channel family protein [Bacilli bacterium]|jgi:small conductance mechanosensitive channel
MSSFEKWWQDVVEFFNTNGMDILMRTVIIIVVIIVGHYLINFILFILRRINRIDTKKQTRSVRSFVISLVAVLLRFALAIIVLLIANVNLSSLASIISAGVLAIGLALQDLIGNFAAGVTLLSSKPFVVGDYITVDEFSGTVTQIGVIHTSLDTPDNQHILLPNKFVINNGLTNYSRNITRRAQIQLNFDYKHNPEVIKKILFDIVLNDERILRSPDPNVIVYGFNNYGFEIRVRFYAHNDNYWSLLFEINERIIAELKKNDIIPVTVPPIFEKK